MAPVCYFASAMFRFLRDLAENNNRPWFQKNKHRYENDVKDPALQFIADCAPYLEKISPHFRADPRPVGGSLFRIYRDIRFSKDKSPFKTSVGIHFRHLYAKDVHAPGFYLHLEPREIFAGVGIWHPDSKTLKKIRDAIVDHPAAWKKAITSKSFRSCYGLVGDSLARAPGGYDPEHPLVEDLKRKDFIGLAHLSRKTVTGSGFMSEFAALCRAGAPLQRFLCAAVDVPY